MSGILGIVLKAAPTLLSLAPSLLSGIGSIFKGGSETTQTAQMQMSDGSSAPNSVFTAAQQA